VKAEKGSPSPLRRCSARTAYQRHRNAQDHRNFFGYSTIVFDFVRRAMPFSQPRTLTGDEVYAATAYLLWLTRSSRERRDGREDAAAGKMPNRDGFIIRFPTDRWVSVYNRIAARRCRIGADARYEEIDRGCRAGQTASSTESPSRSVAQEGA